MCSKIIQFVKKWSCSALLKSVILRFIPLPQSHTPFSLYQLLHHWQWLENSFDLYVCSPAKDWRMPVLKVVSQTMLQTNQILHVSMAFTFKHLERWGWDYTSYYIFTWIGWASLEVPRQNWFPHKISSGRRKFHQQSRISFHSPSCCSPKCHLMMFCGDRELPVGTAWGWSWKYQWKLVPFHQWKFPSGSVKMYHFVFGRSFLPEIEVPCPDQHMQLSYVLWCTLPQFIFDT